MNNVLAGENQSTCISNRIVSVCYLYGSAGRCVRGNAAVDGGNCVRESVHVQVSLAWLLERTLFCNLKDAIERF